MATATRPTATNELTRAGMWTFDGMMRVVGVMVWVKVCCGCGSSRAPSNSDGAHLCRVQNQLGPMQICHVRSAWFDRIFFLLDHGPSCLKKSFLKYNVLEIHPGWFTKQVQPHCPKHHFPQQPSPITPWSNGLKPVLKQHFAYWAAWFNHMWFYLTHEFQKCKSK